MAFAELPPKVYEEMQKKASESLKIRVDKVTSEKLGLLDFSGNRNQTVEATVIFVTRTGSGLKSGDVIVIQYLARKPDEKIAGPRPIPKLQEGKEYPAWLSKAEAGHYEPAARGFSFAVLK
ncbi:MAG: hypothetical protein ACSHX9_09455 [Luteolibacter sp.]